MNAVVNLLDSLDEEERVLYEKQKAACSRMLADKDLISKLQGRFKRYVSSLEKEANKDVKDKVSYYDHSEYEVREVIGRVSSTLSVWDFIKRARSPSEKRNYKNIATQLERQANKLNSDDCYRGEIMDIVCKLNAEVAHKLNDKLTKGVSRGSGLKGFAIRRTMDYLCEVLPIKTENNSGGSVVTDFYQSAPNVEVAMLVSHLLDEVVSPNYVTQILKNSRKANEMS